MKKRQVFYSFHYQDDHWRVHQVRNMGVVDGNVVFSPNKWEEVKQSGERGIQKWIDNSLLYRSCTVVLVGENTAGRKWINYEIEKSWNDKKGLVGVRIHNLKDQDSVQSNSGSNPFDGIDLKNGSRLSSIVKCYNPPYFDSQKVYAWIKDNIEYLIEEAIDIRSKH